MSIRSVRGRTTVLATLVVAAALVLGALGLLFTLRESLIRSDDALAKARIQDLAALVESGGVPPDIRDTRDNGVAQVVDATGTVLGSSSGIAGRGPITHWIPSVKGLEVRTLRDLPDDSETEDYRVWAATVVGPTGPTTIYVGTSLESVAQTITKLRKTLLVGVPFLLAVLGVVTWFVIGRALRPVDYMRSEVAAITHEDLGRRVPVPHSEDEISRLAETMNDMLGRLEAATVRERDFVADASHELQSPLASLRTQLEVALAYPSGTEWLPLAQELLGESASMEKLVRDLLFLAREQGVHELDGEPVDLDDIVIEEAIRLRTTSPVSIDTSAVSAGPAFGRRADLARLARNLLENASTHATSVVTVEVSTDGDTTRMVVADDGQGVPEADRARIFERFARADPSRTRSSGGTGLGLAIARSVAERHGGTLELVDADGGATFELRLPAVR